MRSKEEQLGDARSTVMANTTQQTEWQQAIDELGELGQMPVTHYNKLQEALEHQNTLNNLKTEVKRKQTDTDTYQEQIDTLRDTGVQEVEWESMNDFNVLKDHQDFLYKLLTNKDSFIRKRIIEQLSLIHI